jgi:hypothetical protein
MYVIHHGFRRFLGDMLNAALMVMGFFERFLVGCHAFNAYYSCDAGMSSTKYFSLSM